MNDTTRLRLAIKLALAACATSAAGPSLVYAQTPPATAETSPTASSSDKALSGTETPALQEVVVTGSRIALRPNDISLSPITTVTQTDIQQTGFVRVEDVLNNLPSVTAEQNTGESISSSGVATVSLRDLGSQRTLVLVNGRRMQPGGAGGVPPGNANAADINQIPTALLKSVDVLTGGASSVYGADAVAGVVNFIMDTHFQGVKVDSDYSFYNHSNDSSASQQYLGYLSDFGATLPERSANVGQSKDISIVVGSDFADGKGNATGYFTYLNTSPVAGYQIDHAGCTLGGGDTAADSAPRCAGSGTNATGRFLGLGVVGGSPTTIINSTVDAKTGAFRNFGAADEYNFGALSYLQRQQERYTAGGFTHYDINDNVSVYTETMFARNNTQAQYGPSGDFGNTATISCTNPLLSAQQVGVLCSPANLASNAAFVSGNGGTPVPNSVQLYIFRRNVEGGGRQDNYTSTSIRQVIGSNGKFSDAWTYDVYAQVGITQLQDLEGNFLNNNAINNALNVVTNPATGAPACAAAVAGTDTACVPWNIYSPGGVTAAQLKYLTTPSTFTATSTEYVSDASVSGDLSKYGVQLPTASSGIQIVAGSEYREEKFVFNPDYIYENGLAAGGAGSAQPFDGGLHVWEGFTELHAPLVDKMTGVYNLSFDSGYRYSNYTLGGNTNTYKFQVEYAPIKDIRLRGGYNRAVRAPNLGELFQPQAVGSGGDADPCWGATPTLTLAQCERTGVTAAEYGHITVNPATQTNTIQGGNTGLTPEIADTYTFGIVVQPSIIPNLVLSVDAYNIKIRNSIEELSSTEVINACANSGSLCGLIHRGPSGSLWLNQNSNYVVTTQQNIGSILTRGADIAGHYLQDIGGLGKLSFNLTATYTKDFSEVAIPGTTPTYNCAGYAGPTCGPPLPHYRSVLSTTWQTPWYGSDITLRYRFIGPTQAEGVSQDPTLAASGYYDGYPSRIPGYNYLDLSASAQIGSVLNVRVGVNNITDKDPPVVLGAGTYGVTANNLNDNTWVGTYDSIGRFIYAHVTMKF
jgi:outer membrane receptor protein involved in Fe transport